jgi:nicotinamidase-related amidase
MSLLCRADASILLVIDPQARLMPAIHEADRVIRRCVQLATAAGELRIPVIGTEQNPDRLGANAPEIRDRCDITFAKFHFSAAAEPGFLAQLPPGRKQIVVAGCEAHVCVLQTVDGLLAAGLEVKWVDDAVGSRHSENHQAAAARARTMGADVVTTEMVLFEWLATSQHASFRNVTKLIR